MSRPQSFTVSQIARMIHISRHSVTKEIKRGHLYATGGQAAPSGLDMAYRVSRDSLIRWLIASNFPIDQLRSILNPDGVLLLVRCAPALQVAVTKTQTFAVGSLFGLGQEMARRPCWGAAIDLPAVGTSEACDSLAEIAHRHDRPKLIGLYGDDGIGLDPRMIETFDTLLPRSSPPHILARSLHLLRPGCRTQEFIIHPGDRCGSAQAPEHH